MLFKPTLSSTPYTFRTTRDGALSYFIGNNENYPNDYGFALKHWRQCNVENEEILITGDTVTTLGKVHLIDNKGQTTTVDKTWGFIKDPQGNLRIIVHHSSLEYTK